MARCSAIETHVCEMMERLGIDPGGGALPELGLRYLLAQQRCGECASKRACRDWLDDHSASVPHAPPFCPNFDLLLEMQVSLSVPHLPRPARMV